MKNSVNKSTVKKLLLGLGIAPNISGYGYLVTAIMLKLEYRPMGMCQLYREVGKCNGSSASTVERCMRFAMIRGYNFTHFGKLNVMYNTEIVNGAPMLSEFINYVVEYLFLYGDDESQE